MKRFHVHVSVDDLAASIRFYSTVFGARPAVEKPDYAKWMVEDPRLNFAISKRGNNAGVNHLGIQVDSDEELTELRERAAAAELLPFDQKNAACCYARSDKHWLTDPQGVAWETYHTMESIETFGAGTQSSPADSSAAAPKLAEPQKKACCA